MEGLLPLAVLIGASGTMLAYHRKARKEAQGFQDLIAPGVENAFGSAHANFVRKSAEKYNPLANTMNPLKNPLVAANANPATIANAEQDVRAAIQTARTRAGPNAYDLVATNVSDILLNKDAEGAGIRRIAKCETVKVADCSAFDDPTFATDCGICLDGGRDSGGNAMVGGLYNLEEDKMAAEEGAKRMNSRRVNYAPTVGSCSPYMFAPNKEKCLKIKAQMECARKQNFEVPGCSSCFEDEKFYYLQDGYLKSQPAIFVQGQGPAVLKRTGRDDRKFTLSTSPTRFEMVGLDEGDTFTIAVQGEDSFISGYMEGTTPSGSFRIDLIRITQADIITGAKPRLAGMQEVNGENMSLIRPGRGKSELALAILNPFTFVEPTEEEAAQCASAPFVTKETSANFLNSSPCYKKGQGPGNYSLECLQQTFESAGCTAQGTAYPSTLERAKALMIDGFGKMKSIGQIAQDIYQTSIQGATGKNMSGQQLSIEEWNAKSTFCTGKKITSPCDISDPKGTLSTDCLAFLWNNTGAYQTIEGGPGQTYTNGVATTSLNAKNQNRYCTAEGSMAPIGKNGLPNEEAIRIARSQGSVQNIKNFYDSIHRKANDNALELIQRKEAIMQCYGADVADTTGPMGLKLDIGDRNKYTSVLDTLSGRMQSPPLPNCDIGNVIVYQHCDGAGWQVAVPIGYWDLDRNPGIFPPDASYIRVPPGLQATLYERGNGQGRSKVVGPGETWSYCSEGGWANDRIRSMIVGYAPGFEVCKSQSTYKYRGCWNDVGRNIPEFRGGNKTKAECEAMARAGGYDVFGLQFGGECWLGKNVKWNSGGMHNNPGNCPERGGRYTNQVYAINDPPS